MSLTSVTWFGELNIWVAGQVYGRDLQPCICFTN